MKNQESFFPGYEYEPPEPESPLKLKKPIEMYGSGPSGKTCKSCNNLTNNGYRGRGYYKCKQWKDSHSPATDVRLKWPACGRYEEREKV